MEKKSYTIHASAEETAFIEELRGDTNYPEFLRELLKTHPLVQNHAKRKGLDIHFVFRHRTRGGRRRGAGNPDWIAKGKQKKED